LQVSIVRFEIIFCILIVVSTDGHMTFPHQFYASSVLGSKSANTRIFVFTTRAHRCESDMRHRRMSRHIDLQLCTYILFKVECLRIDRKLQTAIMIFVYTNPSQIKTCLFGTSRELRCYNEIIKIPCNRPTISQQYSFESAKYLLSIVYIIFITILYVWKVHGLPTKFWSIFISWCSGSIPTLQSHTFKSWNENNSLKRCIISDIKVTQ